MDKYRAAWTGYLTDVWKRTQDALEFLNLSPAQVSTKESALVRAVVASAMMVLDKLDDLQDCIKGRQ